MELVAAFYKNNYITITFLKLRGQVVENSHRANRLILPYISKLLLHKGFSKTDADKTTDNLSLLASPCSGEVLWARRNKN